MSAEPRFYRASISPQSQVGAPPPPSHLLLDTLALSPQPLDHSVEL